MYESDLAERYVRALCFEIKEWSEIENPFEIDTIYFGGGTPSLLSSAQIENILATVRDRFEMVDGAEITLEINPGDGGISAAAKHETLQTFRRLGINSASFGAQTFHGRELKQLGRSHDSAD